MVSLTQYIPGGATAAERLGRWLNSRAVLGCAYGLAAVLTGVAILLAASPPTTGPIGPASQLILTVLSFNLVGDSLRAITDPRQAAP